MIGFKFAREWQPSALVPTAKAVEAAGFDELFIPFCFRIEKGLDPFRFGIFDREEGLGFASSNEDFA